MQDWHKTKIRDVRLENPRTELHVPLSGTGDWYVEHDDLGPNHHDLTILSPDGVLYTLEARIVGALYEIALFENEARVADLLVSCDSEIDCRFPVGDTAALALGNLEEGYWKPSVAFLVDPVLGPMLKLDEEEGEFSVLKIVPTVISNSLILNVGFGGDEDWSTLAIDDEGAVFTDRRSGRSFRPAPDLGRAVEAEGHAGRTLRVEPDLTRSEDPAKDLARALATAVAACRAHGVELPAEVVETHARHAVPMPTMPAFGR